MTSNCYTSVISIWWITGRMECGRAKTSVVKSIRVAKNLISRLWRWFYTLEQKGKARNISMSQKWNKSVRHWAGQCHSGASTGTLFGFNRSLKGNIQCYPVPKTATGRMVSNQTAGIGFPRCLVKHIPIVWIQTILTVPSDVPRLFQLFLKPSAVLWTVPILSRVRHTTCSYLEWKGHSK